jgi:F420-non-reducing hydrogenase small subunit
MNKPTMALYWGAGCGGCEISVLELHERFVELAAKVDIVFWPCVLDYKYSDLEARADQSIDLCLVNGAVRNEENVRLVRLLRRKSKTLIAYGACAAWGGIPGLANLYSLREIFECVYLSNPSTDNPEAIVPSDASPGPGGLPSALPALSAHAHPLAHAVEVDYLVAGCPPSADQTWKVCEAFLHASLPQRGSVLGAGDRSVCDECKLERRATPVERFKRIHELRVDPTGCLLEQGVVCCGPATRSGCEARCPSVNMPCRGCYGPAGQALDPGAKMIAMLGSLVRSGDPGALIELAGQVVDPAGTFYCFTLPACLPGRSFGVEPCESFDRARTGVDRNGAPT